MAEEGEKFTSETYVRIYDDKHGSFWQAGPDRDGLDLCELSYHDGDGDEKPMHSFTIPWQAAVMFAQGILTVANENMP
jgi:hypothetical protein